MIVFDKFIKNIEKENSVTDKVRKLFNIKAPIQKKLEIETEKYSGSFVILHGNRSSQ